MFNGILRISIPTELFSATYFLFLLLYMWAFCFFIIFSLEVSRKQDLSEKKKKTSRNSLGLRGMNSFVPLVGVVTGEVGSRAPVAHQLPLPKLYVRLSPHTAFQKRY